MRTDRLYARRLLALAPILAPFCLFAQDANAPRLSTPDIPMSLIYGLVGLAMVQVVFIISLSSIMRTLGGPGEWLKKLGKGGSRAAILLPLIAFATMDASAQAYKGDGSTIPVYHLFWWLIGTNFFLFVLLLAQLNVMRSLTKAVIGETEKSELEPVSTGPNWEQRFIASLTRQKPMEQEQDILLHHEYDGIRELDNVLPPWWLWLFYGSIAWGVVYIVNVHMIGLWPKQTQEYETEMAQAKVDMDNYLSSQASQVDERNVELLTDAVGIAQGAAIFKQNCATCHGQQGEGTAGPNLTDAYWLHGGGIKDLFTTIKYGVNGKAMKAWNTDLKPLEMQAVASFVLSIQGTKPPNPKAPEGEIWKSGTNTPTDSTSAPADTTKLAQAM